MNTQRCAELVERGDIDRYIATARAPASAKDVLFPLYAFNLEVARAPWITKEAHIAEMRLQWWRDALVEIGQGDQVRRHEVVSPLAQVLDAEAVALLDKLIAARRWDIYSESFEDNAHFREYLDATSGHLMWTAARLLGPASEAVVRDAAFAAGLAKWFLAVPELEKQGRKPLVDGRSSAVQTLAREGLTRLKEARKRRHEVSKLSAPALYPVWQAGTILRQIVADPLCVAEHRLTSEGPRARLPAVWRLALGRW